MEIASYLKLMAKKKASDLFISADARVNIKVDGVSLPIGDTALQGKQVRDMAYALMDSDQIREFETNWESNLSLTLPGIGRFRVNIFRQRGSVAMVIRYIKDQIPSIEELNLPLILKELITEPRGLILVVGATGSGKSTTLAAMIDHRSKHTPGHILTIEDPIEYIYQHRRAVVNQREVGTDTKSYANALKSAMREAPDVIMIGEVRDADTMQHALAYSETGHLCLSTLHANNANQALERIINFFPDTAHRQLLADLSLNLRAVISMRLLQDTESGRVPAVEVMLLSRYVSELIRKGEIRGLKEAIAQSEVHGMQTFDQSLYELYQSGRIGLDTALDNSDSRNDLSLRIRLAEAGDQPDKEQQLAAAGEA